VPGVGAGQAASTLGTFVAGEAATEGTALIEDAASRPKTKDAASRRVTRKFSTNQALHSLHDGPSVGPRAGERPIQASGPNTVLRRMGSPDLSD
jgi:hypothetical protein